MAKQKMKKSKEGGEGSAEPAAKGDESSDSAQTGTDTGADAGESRNGAKITELTSDNKRMAKQKKTKHNSREREPAAIRDESSDSGQTDAAGKSKKGKLKQKASDNQLQDTSVDSDLEAEQEDHKVSGKLLPSDAFLSMCSDPTPEMHHAAGIIQMQHRQRQERKRRNEAAHTIQQMWNSTQVQLGWSRRSGLYAFLFAICALFLVAAAASWTIYDTRIRTVACKDNPQCFQPNCGPTCEDIKLTALAATNWIMLSMTVFITVLCVIAAVGTVRKSLSTLRFFSFALVVLIAMEISLLMVFTDAESDVSMEFKQQALGVYILEYCSFASRAVSLSEHIGMGMVSFDDDPTNSTLTNSTGNSTAVERPTVCTCVDGINHDMMSADAPQYHTRCVVDWFDEHLYQVVFWMLILIACECFTSFFAWNILAKQQDFMEMVDGYITRDRKKRKDNDETDSTADILKSFQFPEEAMKALQEEEALITDTWYFESTVVFSVVLAMYVLINDSPAQPPQWDSALLLRIVEMFVTVFLSLEMSLELATHLLAKESFAKYILNPWTVLDIFVLIVSWFYLYSPNRFVGVCRVLRVLRPMRTIRIFESVQIVGRCIAADAVMLRDVMLLTMMLLGGFALVGLTCYHGALQYTCVKDCPIPCKLGEKVLFADLFLADQALDEIWSAKTMNEEMKAMHSYLERDWPADGLTCTALVQANSSYHVAGVCGSYYQGGVRIDIAYEKSTRQRFYEDFDYSSTWKADTLIVSCPNTLSCSRTPAACPNGENDCFPGDDFVHAVYREGGQLFALRQQIESTEPRLPSYMQPQYGRNSWFGRTSAVQNGQEQIDTTGAACVKVFTDPYARTDLGTPDALDFGTSPAGKQRYGSMGGAPRTLTPDGDETGLRGFDNIQQAVFTMIIHFSGDNGMHPVPFGLQDSDTVQGDYAWAFFAISGIILCFVTLNLLLAVCCSAFSEVNRIVKEQTRAALRSQDPFLSKKGPGDMGDLLASVMRGIDLDEPFHGTGELNQAILAKEWPRKGCGRCRNASHTVVIKHGGAFREIAVIMILLYFVLMAWPIEAHACDIVADPNCRYPLYESMGIEISADEFRTGAETCLVLFFVVEFFLNVAAQGWKLYLRRQENMLDMVIVIATVVGTVGTYLKTFESHMIMANQIANQTCGQDNVGLAPELCIPFPIMISDKLSASAIRALRMGRVAQLFRMLYKHKPMFEVMVTVFKSWKAVLGVVVFSLFTVSMFTIICMHLMGGGRGPPFAQCQDPTFCREAGRNPTFCYNSYINPRGHVKNLIVSQRSSEFGIGDSCDPTVHGTECNWLPMWYDTITGSLTDVDTIDGKEANGERGFDWEGSKIDWSVNPVDPKPNCQQFDPLVTETKVLYDTYIADSNLFASGTKCVEIDTEEKCIQHGRCRIKGQIRRSSDTAMYIRYNRAMCMAEPTKYSWEPLTWVEAVGLDAYPRQHFETFGIGMLTQLMVMLGDDWSEVMMDYMINGAIGNWAGVFMSFCWLALHGILYSLFVAVLLINFSTDEEDKMPIQRAQWHHENKREKTGESALLKVLKLESGNEKEQEDNLVSLLDNSFDPDKPHRSFYIFGVRNPVRVLTATIEQDPRTTKAFLILVTATLLALTYEGVLHTKYLNCLDAVQSVNNTAGEGNWFGASDDAAGATVPSFDMSDIDVCVNWVEWFRVLENIVVGAFFTEMVIKSITNGFLFVAGPTRPYLRVTQNLLNFLALCLLSWTYTEAFETDYGENKVKLVRSLAPMVALLQNESIKDVVASFFKSLPGVVAVITPMIFIGLIFVVVGVEYFGSRLRYCVCPDGSINYQNSIQLNRPYIPTQMYPSCIPGNATDCDNRPGPGEAVHGAVQCDGSFATPIEDMQGSAAPEEIGPQRGMKACLERGYAWINPPGLGSFDDNLEGAMTLFLVASSGYVELLELVMDITEDPNNVGSPGHSNGYASYFVVFHLFFNFFLLNLFIGVMSSTFSVQTGKAIVTEGQKRYTQAAQICIRFEPVFTAEEAWRPTMGDTMFFQVRTFCFDIVSTPKFHWLSIGMVFANMLLLCSEHYPISPAYQSAAEVLNTTFLVWFTIEFFLKLVAFGRTNYFGDNWLAFDALIVTASIMLRVAGNGSGLEVFKVLRCCKMIFLAKSLSTLIDLMHIVAASLANSLDVVIIALTVFSIYATMGFRLFAICGHERTELNINNNFDSFGSTFMMLFQIMCGQQFTGIIAEVNQCMIEQYGLIGLGDAECKPPRCGNWNDELTQGYAGLLCEADCQSLQSDECQACIAQALSPTGVFLYFGSFFFMSVYIIANLFIVSVLDSFDVQSRVDQEIDREDLWGFTFAWAELTIGAHACPALTRYEAHEFRTKLADIIAAGEEEAMRNEVSVKISGVPPRALAKKKMQMLFEPYGAISNVAIRAHDPKSGEGGYAVITFNDKDNTRMIDCLSEVKLVEGVPVEVQQFKVGGKFKNGVAHLRVPGEKDETDDTTGTLSIQIRSLKGFLPEEQPYIKCTLCAKHKHHGGFDVGYHTASLSLKNADEGGDSSPRSPGVGSSTPNGGRDSPSMSVGQRKWDHENGSLFYGDIFRYHINEHTMQFSFEAMDIVQLTHTASIGIAHQSISALKDCREPTMLQLSLNRILDDGTVHTGAKLEVEVCFSTHTYVPKFDFLSEFNADNSRHKERDSSGIEGWVYKKSPDHLSQWERTWLYIARAPEPCLRLFESTTSEHQMEQNGRSHQLLELKREFQAHQISAITNGFDHTKESKQRKHEIPACFDKDSNTKLRRRNHALLANCEFQFETVDELEDGRGEDGAEENHGGLLHVHMVEATGLPQMDYHGATDAYVYAHLLADSKSGSRRRMHLLHRTARHTSNVVENTMEPKFDEAWTFKLHANTSGVHFKILDADPVGRDDPIGQVEISVDTLTQSNAEWDAWFDIQPIKNGPKVAAGAGLGRIRFKFEWCSPLDALEKLVDWSARDQAAGRIKKKRKIWRFRAMCPEHKYSWIHALSWLSQGCTGPRPSRIPTPPMHQDDVRIAANNVSMIDLPFTRLRHLLYNLSRFKAFGCKSTREYELYAMFQLELHAYQAQVKRAGDRVVVHRSGLASQLGLPLSHIRGLNFHRVMQRLALLQYGKSNSLPYSQQVAEYEMEKNTVALHVIQTCLSCWAIVTLARKPDGRFPEAAYWRRTSKDIELAQREAVRLKESLAQEKLSALRKKAVEYGVSTKELDRIDDASSDPHSDMLAVVLEYKSRQDSRVNTGKTKTTFFIGALGARNLRLSTLRKLKTLIKRNDPVVVYGDPKEDLKEKLYALQHPGEFVDDPMAPSDGPSCCDRRRFKQLERSAENLVEDAARLADEIEAKVESVATMIGDSVEAVTETVSGVVGKDTGSSPRGSPRPPHPSDLEEGSQSDRNGAVIVRRNSSPMEQEGARRAKRHRRKRGKETKHRGKETELADEEPESNFEFVNPVADEVQ